MFTDTYQPLNTDLRSLYPGAKAKLMVDGKPFAGTVYLIVEGKMGYIFSTRINDGTINASFLPDFLATLSFSFLVFVEHKPFATKAVKSDDVIVYELAISTTGGSAPTGDPGTITGKVEQIIDNQPEPVARTLVAVENKPDGTWAVTGNTISDSQTGAYSLDVLTEGGDTFVLAIDDYGRPFTASASVELNEIIHPTTPNGYVYRVEKAGTLPGSEPEWWVDTGTNHTRTINDVTLRAMAYNRPLCHGALTVETS